MKIIKKMTNVFTRTRLVFIKSFDLKHVYVNVRFSLSIFFITKLQRDNLEAVGIMLVSLFSRSHYFLNTKTMVTSSWKVPIFLCTYTTLSVH